ncbi:sigma-70 family RNA polymerase sigma factor [Streptomyces spiramyceticus]|uniref:sigma-70 family RNA polymerase sigma factor n=1 Tax=Streptomyces spiramyceticus TaxID=299717 RepID=UPI00237A7C73|nr:sigma-70 family RNA polymerase sigma factor [Streptomyces spiramyceticus]
MTISVPTAPSRTASDLFRALRPLLAAEARAEAAGEGVDPGDLEQAVWLRLLELLDGEGPPADPAGWLRRAVQAEARLARRRTWRELPHPAPQAATGDAACPERAALTEEWRRTLRDAVRRLPGRCPGLLAAMLSPTDPTYREIAGALGMSQGSLGPMRSRCLGCLRRMLAAEVAAPGQRGKER